MKVKCLHGYFLFEETRSGQVSDFMSLTGLSLVPKGSLYTFEQIQNAPDYSLKGKNILGLPAIETFEGLPWEVFAINKLIYNFNTGLMAKIDSINVEAKLYRGSSYYVSEGMILPGSRMAGGERVRDYSAWYSRDTQRWLYSEVSFV